MPFHSTSTDIAWVLLSVLRDFCACSCPEVHVGDMLCCHWTSQPTATLEALQLHHLAPPWAEEINRHNRGWGEGEERHAKKYFCKRDNRNYSRNAEKFLSHWWFLHFSSIPVLVLRALARPWRLLVPAWRSSAALPSLNAMAGAPAIIMQMLTASGLPL